MKNKNIYSACIIAAVFMILNTTSCRNNITPNSPKDSQAGSYQSSDETSVSTSETTNSTYTTAVSSKIPENAVTSVVRVTDKNGNNVTDSKGHDVTETITVPDKKPASTAVQPDGISTDKPKTENQQTQAQPEHKDPVMQTLKMTWLCDSKDATLPVGAGQLACITFKIKDDAPDGDYNIELQHGDGSDTGSFVKYDSTKKYSNLDGGIISVGASSARDDNPSPDDYDTYANLSNANGNRGDTVTLYLNAENIHAGIGAFTLKLNYDSAVMELTGITQGSVFDSISKGTFMTNPSLQ